MTAHLARTRAVRALGALGFVTLVCLAPAPAVASTYVPVVPPGTESQVEPQQQVDDGPGSVPTPRVDQSAPPAIARLSYTGVQVGAVALIGLGLVAAGTAVAGIARGRHRQGWH